MILSARKEKVGREMEPALATLSGEAAQQRVRRPEPDAGSPVPLWQEVPSRPVHGNDYYRLPLLKEPVWIWSVPAYFYVGGVAGGSAVLAAFAAGKRRLRTLASWCRFFAFAGSTVGPALLTWDLGKMTRFFNMLRVIRPSSPMSIGSWALAGTGMLSTLSLLEGKRSTPGIAGYGTACGGIILAGYTGVLLGNTANPLWQEKRVVLPVLFTASAVASTAGLLEMLPLNKHEEKVVQRFGLIGKVGEAACMIAMERSTRENEDAVSAVKQGRGGTLWTAAKVTLVAGVAVSLVPGRSPAKRMLGGALTTVGALCLRFALMETGKAAAREPQATVRPQRLRG